MAIIHVIPIQAIIHVIRLLGTRWLRPRMESGYCGEPQAGPVAKEVGYISKVPYVCGNRPSRRLTHETRTARVHSVSQKIFRVLLKLVVIHVKFAAFGRVGK
jgi:hypothetical protein